LYRVIDVSFKLRFFGSPPMVARERIIILFMENVDEFLVARWRQPKPSDAF